jgi:hypothetical protein
MSLPWQNGLDCKGNCNCQILELEDPTSLEHYEETSPEPIIALRERTYQTLVTRAEQLLTCDKAGRGVERRL